MKTSCPKCGSSDANHVYPDGGTYCFSCSKAGKVDGDFKVPTKVTDFTMIRSGDHVGMPDR